MQINTDSAPVYVSSKIKQLFAYYNIKYITGIPHNPTGQADTDRFKYILKDMFNKQNGVIKKHRDRFKILY